MERGEDGVLIVNCELGTMNYKITHINIFQKRRLALLVLFLLLANSACGQGYRICYDFTLFCEKGGFVTFNYKTGNNNEINIANWNFNFGNNSGDLSCKGVIKIDDRSKFYSNYNFIFSLYNLSYSNMHSFSRNEDNSGYYCYEHTTGGFSFGSGWAYDCNCGVRPTGHFLSFYPVFTNALPSNTVDVLSLNDKVSLSSLVSDSGINYLYTWEYSVNGNTWQPLPSSCNYSPAISFSASDILGSSANDYINNNIFIRLNAYGRSLPDGISNVLKYVIKASPPNITVEAIDPKCSTDSGAAKITIGRNLSIGEVLILNVYDASGFRDQFQLDSTKISSSTPYNLSLYSGNYYIIYKSHFKRSVGDPYPSVRDTTSNFTIPTISAVTFTATHTDISCYGSKNGTITLSATGGKGSGYQYSYPPYDTWTDFTNGQTPQITGLPAGNYTLKVKDGNGCIAKKTDNVTDDILTVIIGEPTLVIASITDSIPVLCKGGSNGSITLNASGGKGSGYQYSYPPYDTWTGFTNGQTPQITGLPTGKYSLKVKDGNGCIAKKTDNVTDDILTATIGEPTLVTASITDSIPVLCKGDNTGSITLNASGGKGSGYQYSYYPYQTWTGFVNGQTPQITGLLAGNYYLKVKDGNGCIAKETDNVTDKILHAEIGEPNSVVTASIVSKADISCHDKNDGTITLYASGGAEGNYQYSYSPYETWTGFKDGRNTQITGLPAGNYTLKVKDKNGCIAKKSDKTENILSDSISNPPAISILSTSIKNVACTGSSTGEITVNATGGTGKLSYSWANRADTTKTITNLPAGYYTVTIKDEKLCSIVVNSIQVSEPDSLIVTVSKIYYPCGKTV